LPNQAIHHQREKGRVLKQSPEHGADGLANLRGCRVSAPIPQPWGYSCRIVEWIDTTGQISRRVVAEDVTADEVRATIRRHVEGRKHVLIDDERQPRQTLPRR
jgi:hypothetical protein